jgi:iron(III) transport system substrate-binding protein
MFASSFGTRSILSAILMLFAMSTARAADRSWMSDAALLTAAKAEGGVTLYSVTNEEEALPELKVFEEATGIKVGYIRSGGAELMSRIMVETRAGKPMWDVLASSGIELMPTEMLMDYVPPEAAHLDPQAMDREKRWFGLYTIHYVPAYNTNAIRPSDLPTSYEDFAKHPEWKGHVVIDATDRVWLAGLVGYFGPERGKKLIDDIVATVRPVLQKGKLGTVRSLGAGEYWITLNNWASLTTGVKMAGNPVDFWALDPVVLSYGEIGGNAKAPHPNAARLLINYLLSAEAQAGRTKWGRVPTRADVETNPPGILDRFKGKTLVRPNLTAEEESRWQKTFNQWFNQ